MSLPHITLEGGVVADPELRFAPSGLAIVKVRVVCKDRKRGPSGAWEDGDPCFLTVTVFGKPGENAAESLVKGDRVIVSGRLQMSEYEKDGATRQSYEVKADDVGVAVTFHPARTERTERAERGLTVEAVPEDPWAAQPAVDEPPF